MGRPLNKRFMGSGAGNQIKVHFKLDGTEYDGYLVRQRSTKRFVVSDGTHTGICSLVNKNKGELDDNEMLVEAVTDEGILVQATKLHNRTFITEGNIRVKWGFDAESLTDGVADVADVEGSNLLTITIDTQPVDQLAIVAGEDATFTVEASGVGDLAYQWYFQEEGTTGFNALTGETSATLLVETVGAGDAGDYYCTVSSASGAAEDVDTDTVQLTIAP